MKDTYITKESDDYSLLDLHTGEVLSYKQTIKVSIKDFIMLFFASIPEIMKLESQKLKVLAVCWMASEYGNSEKGNVVHNNTTFKEKVREYAPSMTDAAIDVAFSYLVKHGMLCRICKGEYELNPQFFFKGKLNDRSKLMLKIEVDPKTARKAEGKTSVCFFCKSFEIVEVDDETLL